ncbi:MAG: hypothetical protein ACYTEG_15860 [Planctomycetota bacterium]|jgi:hypothetical protein
MPAEQRVITFGFVAIGLIIVGLLLWAFGGDNQVEPTVENLKTELYPRYKAAEKDRNYNDWRKAAQEILDALEAGKRKTIETNLQAASIGDSRDVQRLYALITDGVVDRVAKQEYPYGKEFYPQAVHNALMDLEEVVSKEFKTLKEARVLSGELEDALEMLRKGSGQPVPAPAAVDLGDEKNPLLLHDAKTFAVLRLDPALVTGALQTKNPGGGANVARINWNKGMPGTKINESLMGLRSQLAEATQVAARFRTGNKLIQEHPQGPAAAKKIYSKACDRLASKLPTAVREQFDAGREAYEKGDVIVARLDAEVKILTAGDERWEALGKALQGKFP